MALEVVRRVAEEGAYSNLALRAALARTGLTGREAALATELAYGTIRHLPALDRALAPLLNRPLAEAPAEARAALRLGAYQLLRTRIPAHAAVSETVGLVSARRRGLVNAVLRRLAASPPEAPAGEGDEAISARSGLAPWAVAELRALLPSEEVEAAALALAAPARVGLRANRCRASPEAVEEALRAAGVGVERSPLHPDCLLLEHGAPAELPGFAEGWFAVQDPASVLVVAALDPRAGERVLDACAGPGGKTGHVACLVGPAGLVVAADVAPSRARLVVRTCERLGVRAAVLVQDGRRPALRAGFDRALVDAPCSGLGAARRRPELLWRAEPAELPRLADLQVGILAATAELLAPGGRLVYSVCTFPRAETDGVCDALLERRPELAPEPVPGPDGSAERLRLWPHRHGCDGMFIAAFRNVTAPRK
ncbi:Ribosomal RNA small subunit methyltransferase B [bacterium HR12]|nr:Ribosomal RNA small subunit methyltransferase B [bacterium HR12]